MDKILIVPPNFYVVDEMASPPVQLEPLLQVGDGDTQIVHLTRGTQLEVIPDADLYGISAYTVDYPISEIIAKYIKGKNPDAIIVLGGSHATYRHYEIDEIFDYVVVGPGESFWESYPNISDRIVYGDKRILNWDESFYELFKQYIPGLHRGTDKTYAIRVSCGCYWNCKFCAPHQKVIFRPLQDIQKQLEFLESKGITTIRVLDDMFTCHPAYEQIAQALSRFKWSCVDRLDVLDSWRSNILKTYGCFQVQVGIESFNDEVREKLGKRLSGENIIKYSRMTKDIGLKIKAFVMLGTPWDTEDTMKESIDKGIELFGNDGLRPDIFCPLPGSEIGDNPERYNLRVLEKEHLYYSPFVFQNKHGKVVAVPEHVQNVSKWEDTLFELLYKSTSDLVRNTLDNPIQNWITDYEYFN